MLFFFHVLRWPGKGGVVQKRIRLIRGGFAGIVLGLAAFLGYVALQQHSVRPPSPSAAPYDLGEVDVGIQGFSYRKTQSGMVQWHVEAEKAQVYESQHRAILEEVQVQLFREQERVMILRADKGTIDTDTNDFKLTNREDDIAVQLANGFTIFTPQLSWVDARQEIRTTAPVRIRGNGLTITGTGLVGNLEKEEFTILDDVRVEVPS